MTSIIKVDQIQKVDGSSFPIGKVLQVIQAEDDTEDYYINSTSYQSTPLLCKITPSSTSSKILVSVSATIGGDDYDGAVVSSGLYRDSTLIAEYPVFMDTNTGTNVFLSAFSFLDSPNTTDEVTYRLYGKASNSSLDYRYNYSSGHSATLGSDRSNIILQEIAG